MTSKDRERFDLCCHVTYLVECIATDLTGEAKFQLDSLIDDLEASRLHDKQEIIEKLARARHLYRSGENHEAAVNVSAASRKLYSLLRWPE
jgi:hypothetical protein